MMITCPQCAAHFQVAEDAFPQGPRNVRCSHCQHIWLANADSDNPDQQTGVDQETGFSQDAEPSQDDPEAQAARLLAASRRINHLYAIKQSNRRDTLRKTGAIAALVAVAVAGLYGFRTDVVKRFPATAQIYAKFDLHVNVRGMEFRNVIYVKEYENGLPVLSVRGEIVNIAGKPLRVPRVRFGLRNATKQEIYHWTMSLGEEPLAPDGSTKFVSRLASPPSDAKDLQIRFADASGFRKRF